MDVDLNVGGLGGVDKNVNTEHNISEANNTPNIDGANNAEKEAKVYEPNLF